MNLFLLIHNIVYLLYISSWYHIISGHENARKSLQNLRYSYIKMKNASHFYRDGEQNNGGRIFQP